MTITVTRIPELLMVVCHRSCMEARLLSIRFVNIIITISTFFLVLPAGTALGGTPWETYLSLPTPRNASMITRIEYTPGAISEKYGYWKPDLDILRNQVIGRDSEAFRLTYRLLQKADGGLAEDLTVILSNTIRARPEFFLAEFSVLQPNVGSLEGILLMLGTEYTDRPKAVRYEMEMRIKALDAVNIKSLKQFRDRCLEIMRRDMKVDIEDG